MIVLSFYLSSYQTNSVEKATSGDEGALAVLIHFFTPNPSAAVRFPCCGLMTTFKALAG
jgi:hypothetical protein